MAFIEYGGKRHLIPAGEMLVGTGADCHLRLEGAGIGLRHAVLTTAPDLSVSIRKLAEDQDIEVNGTRLAALPQSLLHGDKVTIGGLDLLFVDERKSGSTQYVSAIKLQEMAGTPKPKAGGVAGKATAATGGRLVSLTDGREYQIIGGSLTFGRDANSDVVVSGSQVSRRHAEIVVSPRGYILVDSSTNGTWVNGERVQNQRLLARADVIRAGEEEFRFYADAAPTLEQPPVEPPGAPPPVPVAQAPAAAPPPAAPPAAPSVRPPVTPPAPPVPQAPVRGAAQLISTGYFPSPHARPSSNISPRTGEDTALPDAPPMPRPVQAPPAASVPTPPTPQAPQAAAPAAPAAPAAAPAAAAKAPQSLAKFLIRSGALKGQRLYVKVPIVNIGRAEYNDLVVPDDSVSSQHAKLTRREGVWILTDLGSTNGTMVDGERITADVPIAPGAFVRFGDIQLVFEPTDDDAGMDKQAGTRAISAVKLSDIKPPQGR
jgi:pSer/pThr/pTyr-binding forkhead associated (FHA) protein